MLDPPPRVTLRSAVDFQSILPVLLVVFVVIVTVVIRIYEPFARCSIRPKNGDSGARYLDVFATRGLYESAIATDGATFRAQRTMNTRNTIRISDDRTPVSLG